MVAAIAYLTIVVVSYTMLSDYLSEGADILNDALV